MWILMVWCRCDGVIVCIVLGCLMFFFKQKTAYEMRISDWRSDVCSSDLGIGLGRKAVGSGFVIHDCHPDGIWACRKSVSPMGASGLAPDMLRRDCARSEERRVGKECVSPCRSRWAQYH